MNNKYLRVILLPDRETVHNAFFDHAKRGEDGYVLEVFDALAESINVVIVPKSLEI